MTNPALYGRVLSGPNAGSVLLGSAADWSRYPGIGPDGVREALALHLPPTFTHPVTGARIRLEIARPGVSPEDGA